MMKNLFLGKFSKITKSSKSQNHPTHLTGSTGYPKSCKCAFFLKLIRNGIDFTILPISTLKPRNNKKFFKKTGGKFRYNINNRN